MLSSQPPLKAELITITTIISKISVNFSPDTPPTTKLLNTNILIRLKMYCVAKVPKTLRHV